MFIKPDLVFQFILKMMDGFEVRALYGPAMSLDAKLGK